MKFQATPAFDRDYKALSTQYRAKFRGKAFPLFHDCATRAAAGEADPWHNSLRVKRIAGAPGVWEMTWSWSDPDGRATWEWVEVGGEPAVRWRRLGTHQIFNNP